MKSLLVFTWPYALAFWCVYVWAFLPEFAIIARKHEPVDSPQDAHSKRLLSVVGGLAVFSAFFCAFGFPQFGLAHPHAMFWTGMALLLGGSLLRRHCWSMLGQSFTGTVIVKTDQAVIEAGAYRLVRHPSYSAAIAMFAGIGLALGNSLSLVLLLVATAAVYGYRVRVEEAALVSVLGEPYRRYMERTKRFIPFVL